MAILGQGWVHGQTTNITRTRPKSKIIAYRRTGSDTVDPIRIRYMSFFLAMTSPPLPNSPWKTLISAAPALRSSSTLRRRRGRPISEQWGSSHLSDSLPCRKILSLHLYSYFVTVLVVNLARLLLVLCTLMDGSWCVIIVIFVDDSLNLIPSLWR